MATSIQMRANLASRATSASRRTVVCQAGDHKAVLSAVTLAAASLLASSANAGVIIENQPAVKKMFQSDEIPVGKISRPFRSPTSSSAPAAAAPTTSEAPPKIKVAEESVGEGGLDPRVVALPASIAAIGGLGFAVSKIDAGFNDWLLDGPLVRNSDKWAGFEEALKGDNYLGGAYVSQAPTGSRKTKAGTGKTGSKKIFK